MKIGARNPPTDTAEVMQSKITGAGKMIAAADAIKRTIAWTLTQSQTSSGASAIQMLIGRGGGSRTGRTTGIAEEHAQFFCCCIWPSMFVQICEREL